MLEDIFRTLSKNRICFYSLFEWKVVYYVFNDINRRKVQVWSLVYSFKNKNIHHIDVIKFNCTVLLLYYTSK